MSLFSYFPNLPNPPDDPADDVSDMQTNATSINSLIGVDHVGFNILGGGWHNKVTLVAGNAPGTESGQGILFSYNGGASLGYQFPNQVSGVGFTTLTDNSASYIPTAGTTGQTTLCGGVGTSFPILLKWGSVVLMKTGPTTISFAPAFPNNCYGIFTGYGQPNPVPSTPDPNNVIISTASVGKGGFSAFNSSGLANYTLYWLAIGN